MIKLETHCHTYGASSCANTPNEIIVQKYLQAGYGAIVVTNHFSVHSYNNYFVGNTHKEKTDSYFRFIDEFSKVCQKVGIKTFWGTEVRTAEDTEYMVIGLPKSEYYNTPLFNLTQKELFELTEKHGAFMYQTHPFRNGVRVGDPKFLHGAEAFNGHYHHVNNNDKAAKFCKENGLIGLSGTDYHHPDQPVTAGIYAPKEMQTNEDLIKFLFDNNFKIIKEEAVYFDALKKYRGEI